MFDEKEVYKNIGLLSISFARAEENLKTILVYFISQNKTDDIIARTLIDDYTLSKTIELLKKLVRAYRDLEKELLTYLEIINSVRLQRNFFIHGIWGAPKWSATLNDTVFTIESRKIKYSEDHTGRMWSKNRHQQFKLKDIILIVSDLEGFNSKISK